MAQTADVLPGIDDAEVCMKTVSGPSRLLMVASLDLVGACDGKGENPSHKLVSELMRPHGRRSTGRKAPSVNPGKVSRERFHLD